MPATLISVQRARQLVLQETGRLGVERVGIPEALDRVLAQDVLAAGDVPPFPCSAMDGYAVIAGPGGRSLTVVAESRAGLPTERRLNTGEAIRISTGAAVPPGATAVVRQEDVEERDGVIEIRASVQSGANVRHAGEDLRSGATVLEAGTALGGAELGAAVAAGAGELIVARRPRVTILCTGDELRAAGEPLRAGEIHNSNAPMLVALAMGCGAVADPAQQLRDDPEVTRSCLATALDRADVLVVSGGVSVGPHDHVKPALAALGVSERFWGVALAPGKPTWFGVRDRTLVFGLPGNPVSAFVSFSLFTGPAIRALQGARLAAPVERYAQLAVAVGRSSRREQALRVRLRRSGDRTTAIPNGPQGSHLVSSLLGADALAMIPPGESELPAGSRVAIVDLPR